MKLIFKLLGLLLATLLITAGFLLWYQYDSFLNAPVNVNGENAIFEIKPGSSIRTVATQLEAKGIIAHSELFFAHARLVDSAHKLKAGEYKLEPGMKPDDLLKKFVSGQVLQYQLGIIDGQTFKDIAASIRKQPQIVQTLTEDDYKSIMQKLGAPAGVLPEGWFFPDTYSFPRKTTDLEFLQRSYKEMQAYLQKAWDGREQNPQIRTPYEALILASIVEKETGLPEERPLIARVFLNRLAKGMLLQTDPSVIYGIGDRYDGNIRKIDLQTDTPYNTYTRTGLPPTPIATPSKAAIDAVMHPVASDVLYFVATVPGGPSYFSTTYDEHQQAVRKYILDRPKPAVNPNVDKNKESVQ
ncbi:endolytic transglycosylase MltG [Candidatus Thiothrix sp. Deng01]|uniref:Endolytic murein transglycosylase n=1 Tax=Candidatus Thiothrix phosphatis TaxID=3112415 RepID=A0ABU6CU46_9GAMM|nr:endolytic transglycosylase MltG [Candidatus Thiothrix sp. Deng01]MEB4590352.1 endolytic transglycosylase MltG [Candidatus Thiothrix sp. Deng01]